MNTFIKTFFICLILCLGFLSYKFLGNESYKLDLNVSNDSKVFSQPKRIDRIKPEEIPDNIQKTHPQEEIAKDNKVAQDNIKSDNKNSYNCYFYSKDGKLTPIKRNLQVPRNFENALYLLLKGPTIAEAKQGIYTEIPQGTELISVKTTKDSVIVNFDSKFGTGGGSQSVENRVKQISKTAKSYYPDKKIYLYIDDKEVEYLGGDGVYIKQPLE